MGSRDLRFLCAEGEGRERASSLVSPFIRPLIRALIHGEGPTLKAHPFLIIPQTPQLQNTTALGDRTSTCELRRDINIQSLL